MVGADSLGRTTMCFHAFNEELTCRTSLSAAAGRSLLLSASLFLWLSLSSGNGAVVRHSFSIDFAEVGIWTCPKFGGNKKIYVPSTFKWNALGRPHVC